MILLQPTDYHKATDLLNKVDFNNYFAKAVVQHYITGKVYADNTENPTVVYIYHPYGMALLTGDSTNLNFRNEFRTYCLNAGKMRVKADWLQVFPLDWCDVVDEIANTTDNLIESYERVNFGLNIEKYAAYRKTVDLKDLDIVETNAEIFESMPGTVVPRLFWDNADSFLQQSKGFTLLVDNGPVSTAFASFLLDGVLEIGIQTVEGLHGKGYSAVSCCRLIDYCFEHKLEPVWSCKKDNVGSMKLAQKLGFEVVRIGAYYKVSF